MRRGEVWWVNFDPSEGMEIQKCRPAVILTVNALNRARGTVVVVPLSTSAKPRPPIVVPLEAATIRLPADKDAVISDTVNPVPVPDHEPSLL